MVDTNKPTIVIIFGLVILHLLWVLAGIAGMLTIPYAMPYAVLILDLFILYGLYEGQTWSWWLLLFVGVYQTLAGLYTLVAGTATGEAIVTWLLYVVLLIALTKKEAIAEYKPNTTYIKGW